MKRIRLAILLLTLLSVVAIAGAQTVTITYWQYFYESKVQLVDELIKNFEKANPGIKVEQVTFPYESFNQKVAASIPAGEGPDVITLFYGWLPMYVKAGYLQELPKSDFNKAYFDKTYYPFVAESVDFGGKYYSAPTAVRTLALIWNKKLFREAGLDPNVPPKTLDELAAFAKKLSKYDSQGNLIQAGLAMQPTGQGHSWIREVLFRQFGNVPYSSDYRKVTYADAKGAAALKWYTDLITKDKVGYPNFATDDVTAFKAGKAAMNIDGSFRIATLNAVKDLEWGVAELPQLQWDQIQLRILLDPWHRGRRQGQATRRFDQVPQIHHLSRGPGALAPESRRASRHSGSLGEVQERSRYPSLPERVGLRQGKPLHRRSGAAQCYGRRGG